MLAFPEGKIFVTTATFSSADKSVTIRDRIATLVPRCATIAFVGAGGVPVRCSVSAAKTARFVRGFTVTRERYTVTLNHKCRHPRFYRHPPQTKVNRRFLNFGCRHGQQFLPTAGFRFYCHPTGRKSDPVFELRDSFEL